MNEQLQATLARIPLVPLLLAFMGYLGYSYYSFTTDPSSPLIQKTNALHATQQQIAADKDKIKKAQLFYQTLEQRRAEIRGLGLQLEQAKATLSEQIDVSSFVRLVVSQANEVGLSVLEVKPTESREFPYYAEQAFDLQLQGVYVQYRVFLQRLSELETIVRVPKFKIEPVSTPDSRYVMLKADLELDTYRYRGSQADELEKSADIAPQSKPGGSK